MNIEKVLKQVALRDLKAARREGRMVVTGTKVGNIEIEYIADFFTFRNFNTGSFITGRMIQSEAVEKLASLYVVEAA